MKYLILNKEKWNSWVQAAKDDTDHKMVETVLGSMTIDGTILSEKESLLIMRHKNHYRWDLIIFGSVCAFIGGCLGWIFGVLYYVYLLNQ